MTISELASIGEFVSGVAVLISLIYLTVQVRQAKENQRAVLNQGFISLALTSSRWFAEPEHAALYMRAASGETEFTAEELVQLSFMLRTSVLAAQDARGQYKAGLIDRTVYETTFLVLKLYLNRPINRAIWLSIRPVVAEEFREEIDRLLAETPLTGRRDYAAEIRNNLARVMAEAAAGSGAPDPTPAAG